MSQTAIKAETLVPMRKCVFISDLDHGVSVTRSGILLPDDNMSNRGIHARWGRVHAVGSDIDDLAVGEWVLIDHGRWTNGIEFEFPDQTIKLWRVDYPDAILLVSEEDPHGDVRPTTF